MPKLFHHLEPSYDLFSLEITKLRLKSRPL